MHALQQQRQLPRGPCSNVLGIGRWRPSAAPCRHQGKKCNTSQPAAADLAYGSTAYLEIPFVSRSSPKLQARHMQGSPADGLWATASATLLQLELLAAATVDRHGKFGPAVMAALAGAIAGLGVDAFTLLRHGMPQYLQDLLFVAVGAWDPTLFSIAFTAVAIPITAWAVRCWWAANVQLLSGQGGAVQRLQQLMGQQEQQQREQQQEQGGSCWVAGVVAVARALLLSSVVGSATSAIASSNVVGTALAAATCLAAAVAAAAPLVLQMTSSKTSSSSTQAAAAACVVGLEASWVLAMVGIAPVASAVAAVGIAAGLFRLHRQVVEPRLARYQASAGSKVQAHVSLKLAGARVAFDSTFNEDPVQLVAAKRSTEQVQAWQQLTSDKFWNQFAADQPTEQQQEQQAVEVSSSRSSNYNISELRYLAQGLSSWLSTPAARWEPLLPFVAETACGMYLGETRKIDVLNPKAAGYWNPSYSWWQPTADVAAKFKGQMPSAGDVFWYPVSGSAYVPTRVTAIGEKYVELDANYGVTDTMLQLEVTLVALHK